MRPRESGRTFFLILAALLVLVGMGLRVHWMSQSALWCDEAESSINALTILQTGVPGWKYLGLPVYENTLSEPWEDHPEYEFRDSSYSLKQGVVVYHGWLPIYSIALSQWIFGMRPDSPQDPPRVLHDASQIDRRTTIPRLPSLLFSLVALIVVARLGWALGGPVCGLSALTLMSLNARTVDFGFQARYYSLTLLMTAIAAWFLWRVGTRGKWRDYLLLGLVGGLLFHTHLLSFFVFSMVALAAAPFMARQTGWWIKAGVGGMLSVALIFPWMLFSGFLETADSVPKVFRLFGSPWDLLQYAVDRPLPLLILSALALAVTIARLRPGWMNRHFGAPGASIANNFPLYVLLLFWMFAAYVSFHLIVPAASFFFERLTLVLWVPFILLLGLLASDLLRVLEPKRAVILSMGIMICLLTVRSRLAFFESSSISQKRPPVAALLDTLGEFEFQTGTRFYATPNDHLTWTYYSGLPVQSVAPVRRDFFEAYPDPVVFIESQMDAIYPTDTATQDALRAENLPITQETTWQLRGAIWNDLSARDLWQRGILRSLEQEPWEVPAFQQLREATHRDFARYREEYFEGIQTIPTFRGMAVDSIKELWLGFFYRFVNPEQRLGENLNILPRLRSADIAFLPEAGLVLYYSESPSPQSGEPRISD